MNSWERRPGETDRAWNAFRVYRDQIPPRNLRRTAQSLPDESISSVVQLCNEYHWRERVGEYDAYLDRTLLKEKEEFLREDSKRRLADHLSQLKDAREAVANEVRKILNWSKRTGDEVTIMQPAQVAKFMDVVIKLERLVNGESTENTSSSIDLSGLSVEEIRALNGILEKANIKLPGLSGHRS